jgi:hypothetical protein
LVFLIFFVSHYSVTGWRKERRELKRAG